MSPQTISIELREKIAILTLERGTTNPINGQLISELTEVLEGMRDDPNVQALVLASANDKFFSIGFDIPEIYELPEEEFTSFYRSFNRLSLVLYSFPKPTIAALSGHAIAGGCILALCCDLRFIANGHKLMGLNEVRLGVPVPYPADCILRDLVGSRWAREIVEMGDFYLPEHSLEMGMVDQVLHLEQVLPETLLEAGTLGAMPRQAYAAIKGSRVEIVKAQVLARLEEKERRFVKLWYAPNARERIKEAMEKF